MGQEEERDSDGRIEGGEKIYNIYYIYIYKERERGREKRRGRDRGR